MTVQDLIDALDVVEDRSKPVAVRLYPHENIVSEEFEALVVERVDSSRHYVMLTMVEVL